MKRKPQHSVELADGRTVRFSIKSRSVTQSYFVVFVRPDNFRLERSKKESNQKRALEAAIKIIRKEFLPKLNKAPSWEEASLAVMMAMAANNNRQETIDDYENTLQTLRRFFPASRGPADISTALAKQFKVEYLTQKYTRKKPTEPKIWKGIGRKPEVDPKNWTGR